MNKAMLRSEQHRIMLDIKYGLLHVTASLMPGFQECLAAGN